jgi:hypothetical protein
MMMNNAIGIWLVMVLSLKFRPQMVTGIHHLQTAMSSPMDQNYQFCFFQKVQNYTISYKIKVRYDYTGRARTCAIQKCKKSAHAHDA